jgi:chromosomal replication initiator protein
LSFTVWDSLLESSVFAEPLPCEQLVNKIDSSVSGAACWSEVHSALPQVISPEAVQRWFSDVRMVSLQGSTMVLAVANEIFKYWIEDNYLPQVNSVATKVLGRKISAKLVLSDAALSHGKNSLPPPLSPAQDKISTAAADQEEEGSPALGLNPRYTFESFIVGPNNEMAAAAAKAVADAPARTYNPLFLHGRVGLGKTHLMHAIGNALARKRKHYKVQYVTSEQFTNEFISAIQHGELVKFRKRYRQVDALLIDDVQFLADKERSQEEFFHTFNSLFDGSKQIILTCDSPPSEISNIEKRLSSRFEWGLTAEIMPPGIETRIAILRHKLAAMQVEMHDDLLMLIATRVKTNVRKLEGALTRVAAYAALHGQNITVGQVEILLKDLFQNESPNAVTIDHIQRKVAEIFDIRLADMTSKRRPANIALPRMVAMYISRRLTSCSLNEIGDAFGGRDHGTVLHAARSIDDKIKLDPKLQQTVHGLMEKLQQGSH